MNLDADPTWAPGLLPETLDRDTTPFWEAAREQRLTYQRCRRCGTIVFFPRQHCRVCLAADLEWLDSAGIGKVYTFSVVRNSRDPRFADRVPYMVAYVDLDEGFRMMSNLVEVAPERVSIGLRVEVTWRRSGEWQLPVFRPRGSSDGA